MNPIIAVPEQVSTKSDCENDPLVMSAMEGFLLVLSSDGDMVFLSENVQDYLGLNQVSVGLCLARGATGLAAAALSRCMSVSQLDMMGHSIYEFSHPCDHDEIKEILSEKAAAGSVPRSSFLRMKCTLTSKGRNVNLKSASYKVIHYTGHMLTGPAPAALGEDVGPDADGAPRAPQHCLVAIGEPIPHPSNIEIPLDKQTFLSKHSLDMRFTYADDKYVALYLRYHSSMELDRTPAGVSTGLDGSEVT